MSYDVSFYIDAGNGPVKVGESYNYTYNLAAYFEVILGNPLKSFHDNAAHWLLDAITWGLEQEELSRVEAQSPYGQKRWEKYEPSQFEPENGWGDVQGARYFLFKIALECAKAPNAKVCIS